MSHLLSEGSPIGDGLRQERAVLGVPTKGHPMSFSATSQLGFAGGGRNVGRFSSVSGYRCRCTAKDKLPNGFEHPLLALGRRSREEHLRRVDVALGDLAL